MANLKGIVSRLTSNKGGAGGRSATGRAGRTGGATGGTGGNRSQDEAIGRGIRKVFKRFR